ncbi:MAG: hypothetical protein F9K26_07065 [Ignavibacteriaceae bacterium]|nr:MAG: hypothetical protein F9K26_07065 [Ignavibacteriaceae bacterium]
MIQVTHNSTKFYPVFRYFTRVNKFFKSRKDTVIFKKMLLFSLIFTAFSFAQAPELVVRQEGTMFINPKVSPDGKLLAFTQEGYRGLFIMNDKNEITKITDDPAAGFGFSWLHDNSGIVARPAKYDGMKRSNGAAIYYLNGNAPVEISEFSTKTTTLPGVSTGGEVFFLQNGVVHAYSNTSRSSEERSPAGVAAFIENDKISVTTTAGEKRVIEPVKGERCINAALSPDGNKVVFEVMGGDLYIINSDGTGLIDLGTGYRGAWSPDSKKVTYMLTTDDGHQLTSSQIYTVNADGTNKTKITNFSHFLPIDPSFSADGKFIYFANITDGSIMKISAEAAK